MGESQKFERSKTPETGAEHFTDSEKNELYLQRSEYLLEQLGKDALTGLGNRIVLHRELAHALRFIRGDIKAHNRAGAEKIRSLAVLFIDLDNFGEVNKSLGHLAGDKALKSAAHALSHSVRETDVATRFGGDEFCVLLPRATEEEAKIVAGKILENIKSDSNLATLNIGASIGISSSSMSTEAETLIHLADQAAKTAKQGGKNQFVVSNGELIA